MANCQLIYWRAEHIWTRFIGIFGIRQKFNLRDLKADVTSYVIAVARIEKLNAFNKWANRGTVFLTLLSRKAHKVSLSYTMGLDPALVYLSVRMCVRTFKHISTTSRPIQT